VKKRQIVFILISIVIIGGGVGVYFLIQSASKKSSNAPDYELQSIAGYNFTISSLENTTIILDFMSVTCIPCKQMYPILNDLLNDDDLKGKIEIISIETDYTTTIPQLETYALDQNITWTLCKAPTNMTEDYGVVTLPTFVIINPEGLVTYIEEGIVSFDKLKEESQKAIEGTSVGIQITSYQGFIIGFAIVVAISSFFSPCSFPLLPGYVAHIIGVDIDAKQKEEEEEEEADKNLKQVFLYPLLGLSGGIGILFSYLILGVIVSSVGKAILPYLVYALPIIGGLFIILGILMFTNFNISFSRLLGWLRKEQMKISKPEKKPTIFRKLFSTFLYGLGYGIASLGCNGPIFLAFSLQVSGQETIVKMIFAYLAFSLTIILLMVGVTIILIFSRDVIVQKLKASTEVIKKISGVIMLLVGIYLILEFVIGA
jgi:cytochrome c-type biogenesis protein